MVANKCSSKERGQQWNKWSCFRSEEDTSLRVTESETGADLSVGFCQGLNPFYILGCYTGTIQYFSKHFFSQ